MSRLNSDQGRSGGSEERPGPWASESESGALLTEDTSTARVRRDPRRSTRPSVQPAAQWPEAGAASVGRPRV